MTVGGNTNDKILFMALTKEELDKIKLPLSDEDYRMLREEDARTCYKVWQLASPELREAFDKKEAERVDCNCRQKTGRLWNYLTGKILYFDKLDY